MPAAAAQRRVAAGRRAVDRVASTRGQVDAGTSCPRPARCRRQIVAAALLDDAVDRREAEPVPLPCSFVVKNGSKMRARVSASMPLPVSLTASTTYAPGATSPASPRVRRRRARRSRVSIVSVPPRGIASRALTARFRITCSSWPGSALHAAERPARASTTSSTSSPISAPQHRLACSATTSFRSRTRGAQDLLAAEREELARQRGGALAGRAGSPRARARSARSSSAAPRAASSL